MPDEALLDFSFERALHDRVRPLELLIPGDDLDETGPLLVRLVEGKVPIHVENHRRRDKRHEAVAHVVQGSLLAQAIAEPRPPLVERRGKSAIAKLLALGGDVEHVRDKRVRHALLVVEDVARRYSPVDRRTHRALGLAHHHQEPVDVEDEVETLHVGDRGAAHRVGHLPHAVAEVVLRMRHVEEVNRRRLVLGTARE